MGSLSIWHWLIVLVVVLILFGGRGKVSQLMGDFGRGLKAFKKSIREDDEPFEDRDPDARSETRALPGETPPSVTPSASSSSGTAPDRNRDGERERAARP